jgi:hypothetical protein
VDCSNPFLEKDLNNPPTAVGGIRRHHFKIHLEKHLNDPPTAVGGISDFCAKQCGSLFGGGNLTLQ